ncbi:MAG: hypothetical protein KC445_03170 [Anaerolineales bacterium]|nr:hypothetical protein [Anaerolineales bacterium]
MGSWRNFFFELKRPSKIIFVLLIVLTGGLVVGIVTNFSPWLRGPDEWRWAYAVPGNWARHLIPLGAVVAYAVLVFRFARKIGGGERPSRGQLFRYLLFCTLSIPVLQLALLAAESPNVVEQLYFRTISWGSSGFFSTASIIESPGDFLRHYPELMPTFPVHPQRYPPGIPLLIYAAKTPLAWLGVSEALGGALRLYQCLDLTLMRIPNGTMAAAVVQMALPFVSAWVIFPLFGLARRLLTHKTAVWAAALFPLIPSFALWSGRWDQFFPLLTVLAWYLLVRGLMAGKRASLFLAGLVLGFASLLSFGLVAMLAPMGLWALLYIWSERNGRSPRQLLQANLVNGLIFTAGLVSWWLIIQLAFGTSFLEVWRVSMRFHLGLERSYWTWLGYHLYDFGLFLGVPLAILCLVAFTDALRLLRQQLFALPLAFCVSLLLLDLSGTAQGEVARVWIFLTPFAVICAAWAATRLSQNTKMLGLLLGLIGLQLVAFNGFLRVVTTGVTAVPDREMALIEPGTMQPVAAPLAHNIALRGYEVAPQPGQSGEPLTLTLYWQATDSVEFSYTVFNHLVAPDGTLVAQQDGLPVQGQLPTTCWLPDELILDLHTLALPADLPNGRYTLMTGLYDSISGQRLPLQDGTGADAIVLGSIAIEQP